MWGAEGDQRVVREAEPFSGMATMAIANKLKFTWFFFCGNEREGEANTIRLTEECINDLAAQAGIKNAAISLKGIKERPLAICTPLPPSPGPVEQYIVSGYASSLAVAYFELTAEMVRLGEKLVPGNEPGRGYGFRQSAN